MQWYHVEMQQDETLKVNGHLRSGSASEAVKIALGRERRWPVQEVGRDAARAIDPENPENWCKASGVKGPAWPSTKEAPEKKKKAKKKAAPKAEAVLKKPARRAVAVKVPAKAPAKAAPVEIAAKPKPKKTAAGTRPKAVAGKETEPRVSAKPARKTLKKSA